MSTQQAFIDKVAPHAMTAQRDHGILSSLTIAQAILESGWGKSSIGNNIFGIKANTSWKGKTKVVSTREYINGQWITVQAKFRDYDSIEDSIKDHTSLFVRLPRYHNLLGETDYERACYLVYKDGYATDPDYPSKLTNIIKQYKLYEYDKLAIREETAVATVQEQFKDARDRLMAIGITNGADPRKSISREQAWAMLDRAFLYLQEHGIESYGKEKVK